MWWERGEDPGCRGRAGLVGASPLCAEAVIAGPGAKIVGRARGAAMEAPYVQSVQVDGRASNASWLPASFVQRGGTLDFELGNTKNEQWGAQDVPPSHGPR